MNTAGTYLYLVSQSQPDCSSTCSGALAVFLLGASGTLGTALTNGSLSYWPLTLPGFSSDVIVPTGVTVLANNDAVYVTAYDQSAYNPGGTHHQHRQPRLGLRLHRRLGRRFDPGHRQPLESRRQAQRHRRRSHQPLCLCHRLRLQPAHRLHHSVGKHPQFPHQRPLQHRRRTLRDYHRPARQIHLCRQRTGLLGHRLRHRLCPPARPRPRSTSPAAKPTSTDTRPVSIVVDPALGRFVYTANLLGNSVSGFHLDPNTGALSPPRPPPIPPAHSPPLWFPCPTATIRCNRLPRKPGPSGGGSLSPG